ncbi:MAG: hypothetical protein E7773_04565 [Sphingomonas sp.]|uniref:hypothetical protein n=1 Tax=Sphingomonas sp. TaxID=28214 RepID=UPI00120E99AE|nr:hypothetical protein [Sphingomonas sp.]THD37306.1 MAG: hypothetical protein E7773_04565 [Sphingomonas sp.]
MTNFLTKTVLAASLGATALTAAAPADAQYYRGRYHRNNDGAAIVAGVAGLAIGAALASSANRDRYYRDDYYYNNYNTYPRYNYYNNDYRYNYRACRIERRYDPYYGRSVRVRVCY